MVLSQMQAPCLQHLTFTAVIYMIRCADLASLVAAVSVNALDGRATDELQTSVSAVPIPEHGSESMPAGHVDVTSSSQPEVVSPPSSYSTSPAGEHRSTRMSLSHYLLRIRLQQLNNFSGALCIQTQVD